MICPISPDLVLNQSLISTIFQIAQFLFALTLVLSEELLYKTHWCCKESSYFSDEQTQCNLAQMQICNRDVFRNFSQICTEQPYTEDYQCYPEYLKNIGVYFGIWCVFISVLGMFGNLLTMLAIPYAANRRK